MSAATALPSEIFAGVTRRITEAHETWDSPHRFVTLHWDGERLDFGTVALITADVHPGNYPNLMLKTAREAMTGDRASTLCGYALQIEGHSVVEPGPEASAQEWARFQADRIGRRFHTRPDAVESALTYCADIHGRVWGAIKRRGVDGIDEVFYAPGERASHGQMVDALLSVAIVTRTTVHGLSTINPFGGRS
ncbi:hypothetical protein [Actinomadura formosensis]|uniref:hypothetical protein n=1 Tax=Actinomadura formosensis TaxID=60706 RepID=UPI003D924C0F